MLIAHVITRLLRAGSEENTIATCLAQARSGHDVMLIHGNEWDRRHATECGKTLELVEIPDLVHAVNPRKDWAATQRMKALFRDREPAVVHTHQSKAGIVGRVAARLAGVPYIVHGVHVVPFVNVGAAQKTIYLAAERAVARFTHAFINVSDGTRRLCLDHSVGRPEQHFVAHSGMDVSSFRGAAWPTDWRAIVGVGDADPKPPTVLMLAALEPRKRHVEFIESFGRALERVPSARLLIAGEGPARPSVEAAVARAGFGPNLRMLGFSSEPHRLIALADVTVLTSMREGLPRVVVQSLAGGRPVVTTDLPGIDDIVKTDVNGIVVPSDDIAGAADAVASLLLDPVELARLQAGAARTDVSSWGVESMCERVSAIYDQVMRSAKSDRARPPAS